MPDDIEEIEARLAAYIDGTLAPEQTAEIEAYLAANPTHGKLIEELKSIRAAVRSLPRETAPAEVLDTLQSQLERHALLTPEHEPMQMPIRRWPQLGAVAAVLLLAGGLGLLIYQVMPGARRGDADLALLSGSTSPSTPAEAVTLSDLDAQIAANSVRAKDSAAATRPGRDLLTSNTGQSTPELAQAGVQQQALQQNFKTAAAELSLTPPAVTPGDAMRATRYVAATGPSGVTRSIIVRSDDPALTRNLLAASLTRDRFAYEVPTVTPTSLATITPADASGATTVQDVVGRLRQSGDLTAGEADAALYARNVFVRGITRDAALTLVDDVNRQRPGRQIAGLTGEPAAPASELTDSATRPAATTQTTPGNVFFADRLPRADNARRERIATTAPTGDLVVLIVPSVSATPSTTTTPATTQVTTAPATEPGR